LLFLPYISLEDKPLEAQMDIQSYLERGKQALAQGQARDAAIAYAHAAQLEPDNPMAHLGLAEANLALGSYGVVYMACRKVLELQPMGGLESTMAQALLNLLDRRYDRALQEVDRAIEQDPGVGYAHALRAYLLRLLHQDYDAGLARARAARLSYGGRFDNCFPPVEPAPVLPGYGPAPVSAPPPMSQPNGTASGEPVPTWSRPNGMQRQVIRTRFVMSQNPRLATMILIGINLLAYAFLAFLSKDPVNISTDALLTAGGQVNILVSQGEYWRIFTAMFLHFSLIHIGLNMLSLFFIGPAVEVFYGKWRYLVIYLVSGIVGGIVTYFLTPPYTLAAGASGAIFGVFGALGIFYIFNRNTLGAYGRSAIVNWLFWLILNIAWSFQPGIGLTDHVGGLVSGMILAAILMPRLRRKRTL
jgi:membrane associated rhomboid family serine protease